MSVVTGLASELYWARESAFKNAGVGMPVTGTATHQPLNPAEGDINLIMPTYEQQLHNTTESLDPDSNLTHDKNYGPGEGSFPNGDGFIYRDPMFMCATVFPNKAITGTWAGGAGTYGKITADFTALTYEDTVMMQYLTKTLAGVTVESRTILGIKAAKFRIGFAAGDFLRTWYDLISAQELDNTQAYSASASYDDGRWADWAKSTYYPATDCKIYWDDSFASELADIKISEAYFDIMIPQNYGLVESSSLVPFARNNQNREYTAEIIGWITGDTELDEFRAAYPSKTKKNLRMIWDSTASEKKFMDIDDAFVESIEATQIKAAGDAWKVTMNFRGYTCDYEGNFNNLADPTTGTRVNGS